MTRSVGGNELGFGVGRAFASLVVIATVGICLTSCLWSSNNDFPMFVTETRGGLEFLWCGTDVGPYGYASIHHRGKLLSNDDIQSTFGTFALHNRDRFSLRTGLNGLQFEGDQFNLGDGSLIFVYFGVSADEYAGPNPQFEVASMTQISDGNWLSPTGLVTRTPCE